MENDSDSLYIDEDFSCHSNEYSFLDSDLNNFQNINKKRKRELSIWEKARKELVYLIPPKGPLSCREQEHEKIFNHLENLLKSAENNTNVMGGVLFIAGVPGTGKTATVRIVVKQLKENFEFNFVEINAMKFTDPKMAYTYLWLKIKGVKKLTITPLKAKELIDNYLRTEKKKKMLIILVDELEMLLTKDQQVLYSFFEWAQLETSQFAIVAIANMLDLPERVHQKLNSRMGTNRIIFNSYKPEQLKSLLQEKMKDYLCLFEDDSVFDYISKTVGASKGDARLTFEVCRRALQFAQSQNKSEDSQNNSQNIESKVGYKHINQVLLSMRKNPVVLTIQKASFHQKIWILAVLIEIGLRRQFRESLNFYQKQRLSESILNALNDDVTFFEVAFKRYEILSNKFEFKPLNPSQVQKISKQIAQIGVFNLNWKDSSLQSALYLKLDPNDILQALNNELQFKNVIESEGILNYFKGF